MTFLPHCVRTGGGRLESHLVVAYSKDITPQVLSSKIEKLGAVSSDRFHGP